MACSAALRWMASVMYCRAFADGRLARFGVEPLQQVGGVVPGVALDLLQQQLLGFVGGQAGDPLELVLLLRDQLLGSARPPASSLLLAGCTTPTRAPADRCTVRSLAACRSASLRFAASQRLLERLRLLAFLPGLAFGVGEDVVRLLLGVEQDLLAAGLGVALGVLDDAERPAPRRGRWSRRRCASGSRSRAANTAPARDEGNHRADEVIRPSATRVTSFPETHRRVARAGVPRRGQ